MSDLPIIEFATEAEAEEVRQRLLAVQKERLIELGDAVVALKDPDGSVELDRSFEPALPALQRTDGRILCSSLDETKEELLPGALAGTRQMRVTAASPTG